MMMAACWPIGRVSTSAMAFALAVPAVAVAPAAIGRLHAAHPARLPSCCAPRRTVAP